MFVFAMCMSLCVEIQRMRCLSMSMYVFPVGIIGCLFLLCVCRCV